MNATQILADAIWHLAIGCGKYNYHPTPSDRDAIQILMRCKLAA